MLLLLRAVAISTFCLFPLLAVMPARKKAAPQKNASTKTATTAQSSLTPAQRWLKSMNLHDEVAQLVIMPCYGEAINPRSKTYREYQHLIRDVHVGGMIVLGHVQNGAVRNADPLAMSGLFNRFQQMAKVPLLIGGDFERGASMRVNGTTPWPHNMAFAAGRKVEASRLEGAATAKEARALGVNWIFAPVSDVNNNPLNPAINIRSYGENPREVASHVEAFIEGAHANSKQPVLVTVKHFPGQGDTAQDTHTGLARLEASRERIESVEFVPFRAAIEKGVDAVMTAHMAVPALEPREIPATSSARILTGVLRDELKFQGLIVTDAMNMQGLLQIFDTREAAVRSIEAGADVLLMPLAAEQAIAGVMAAVRSGRISKQRLDESVVKVLNAKMRLGLDKARLVDVRAIGRAIDSSEDEKAAQEIADRSVTLVRNAEGTLPARNPNAESLWILTESKRSDEGKRLMEELRRRGSKMNVALLNPAMSRDEMDRAVEAASGSGGVVVAAFAALTSYRGDAALPGEYPALLEKLLTGKAPVTLAAIGSPYLIRAFPSVKTYLTTYSNTPLAEVALVKALYGEIEIGGRLPVSIPGIAKYGDGIQIPANKIVGALQ